MTPEQRAGRLLFELEDLPGHRSACPAESCGAIHVVASALRAAEAEGRAAALEEAARYVERCDTAMTVCSNLMQIVTTDQVAAGIRSLLNQGRAEGAPKSTQTPDIAAEEK